MILPGRLIAALGDRRHPEGHQRGLDPARPGRVSQEAELSAARDVAVKAWWPPRRSTGAADPLGAFDSS